MYLPLRFLFIVVSFKCFPYFDIFLNGTEINDQVRDLYGMYIRSLIKLAMIRYFVAYVLYGNTIPFQWKKRMDAQHLEIV